MRRFFILTTGGVAAIVFILAPLGAGASYTFTNYLDYGSSGPDVSALQQTLKDQGHFSYPNITDWFGPVTQEAVQKFQCALNIVCGGSPATTGYGRVGPATLNALNNLDVTTTAQTTTTTSYTFARDLGWGVQGEDVRTLQQFLNANGFPVAENGAGLLGNETTYFGHATQAALANFQAAHGIVPAVGFFGPLTRAKIAELTTPTEPQTPSVPVPDYPQSLKVEESRSYRVVLSWDTVDGATSYNIKRKGEDENDYSVIGTTATTTIFTDTHVSSRSWYSYIVTASNAGGESSPSSVIAALARSPGGGGGGSPTPAPADTTAPSISSAAATDVSTSTESITWTTDESATSRVAYGSTALYGSYSTLDSSLVTSHSVSLTGLTASTTYHYAVVSTDSSGNTATSSDGTFTTSVYDYFVDSVNGDDGNTGLTSDLALKTISAVEAKGMWSGIKIGLAKGSTWREQLDITVDHATVAGYGTGDKPLLDASDPITNGDWSKTGGYTNVYQTILSFDDDDGEGRMRIWEDGEYLTLATSIANVDATPGTYYTANHLTSPTTVYLHPADSSNPQTNSKLYEYPKRNYGIHITGDYATLRDTWTRRQQHSDGSTVLTRFATVNDCRADEGTVHAFMVGEGSDVNGVAINGWAAGVGESQFILYTGSATGQDTQISNLTLDGLRTPENYNSGSPFYAHANGGSKLGSITISNVVATNIGSASISAGDLKDGASLTVDGYTATKVRTGIGLNDVTTAPHIYKNISIDSSILNTYGFLRIGNNNNVELDNASTTLTNAFRTAIISYVKGSGTTTLSVLNSHFTTDGTAYGVGADLSYLDGVDLTVSTTIFDFSAGSDSRNTYLLLPASYEVSSDYNDYVDGTRKFIVNGVNKTLSEWRTLTGQDANSTP